MKEMLMSSLTNINETKVQRTGKNKFIWKMLKLCKVACARSNELMKHELMRTIMQHEFDHVILGMANQIEFKSHVIKLASPPMHD